MQIKCSNLYFRKFIVAAVKDLFILTTRFPASPRTSQCIPSDTYNALKSLSNFIITYKPLIETVFRLKIKKEPYRGDKI